MRSTQGGAFARLLAGGTAAATACAGLAIGLATPAHAAVTISGSTIDAAGNYVDGFISIYHYSDQDGDGTVESSEYDFLPGVSTQGGAFDLNLEDGLYKLQFYPSSGTDEYRSEYYRDKADLASADFVTVAGAAQVLPAWTIDSAATVTGTVATTDGRAVRNARVEAYAADDGMFLAGDLTDSSGAFRIGADEAVKLRFSGYDSVTGKALATEYYSDKSDLASADAVAPGAVLGTITLAPGGSISGRVTSEAGAPLHRALACTEDYCDYTDANGVYTIEGVQTGAHVVEFSDPIDEFAGEYYNNVAVDEYGDPVGSPAVVNIAPGQAVAGIDAALAAKSKPALTGVDISGTVRDQVGGLGVGYNVLAYDTPADPRDRKIVARTISNRAGGYAFTTLDRVGGETEFKIVVEGEAARERNDFARRTIWTGQKFGYDTAAAVTAAPQVIDFVQPVAGGVAGAVTSEAGGAPEEPWVAFVDADDNYASSYAEFQANGAYETRNLWPGDYTVQFGGARHVPEWWNDAVAGEAKTITVKPGEVLTGISAALAKDVKAVERPSVTGDAWVGKTIRMDKGVWTAMAGTQFTYEWLVKGTVVATGPSLKITKKHLGDKITGRVTNDAGFTQGQAITKATAKVGYKPKVKAKVTKKSAAITLKVKPLKAKKVKATVTVFKIVGVKKNGDDKLKKLGKAKIKKGKGVVTFKKPLGKGKHKLVFTVKGKGKVGSGDIQKKYKIKR
ncbi:carboxypeptidase-like regulatory domain-containing protein [Nocardioides sp. zg-1228]|uniref:carboxypeptidase-like regulatory domain-containing protein n=1 Tax=Nocardioides sp. zg-1228 TaxID=2763008 RepID=UPI00164331ED|nr:carboxypeptidase-like regulatory domain-containing protein [Nocardioides sp. zg-1228]MBC2931662.1 carboxypeptidase regulatory-like domain-containing protein [Nocardioides sp. zg-1228]QSF57252.1 carboxypeptidase regulatory-like domain-containing protein [Nocardioides sp. zg-1228]